MAIEITTPAFENGKSIPVKNACDGDDVSPLIRLDNVPKATVSLALIMEDPDAPDGIFTHWMIYNIPPKTREIEEIVPIEKKLKNGSIQGKNDFGNIGYRGPCPPKGEEHRYFFRVYALKRKLDAESANSREDFLNAIKNLVLDEGEYMGKYRRKK